MLDVITQAAASVIASAAVTLNMIV
jgi:hypothetical protein